jgi:hypothetical protein
MAAGIVARIVRLYASEKTTKKRDDDDTVIKTLQKCISK